MDTSLAVKEAALAQPFGANVDFTEEQVALIKRTIARGASDDELALFLLQCRMTGLNPFTRQIYSIRRKQWNAHTRSYEEGQVIQVSIDGFRLVAERSHKYAGQLGPFWCAKDGEWVDVWLLAEPPAAAKVGVLRHDFKEPVWAVALFDSYAQKNSNGELISRWKTDPAGMLAKCFSPDTEVLTDRGFQPFGQVTGRILQVTGRGLEPAKAKPFAQKYSGEMITLDSDDLNFSVTPNHDMWTTSGKVEAGEMYARAGTWRTYIIPRLVWGTKADTHVTDEILRLTAAYIADGWDTAYGKFKVSVSRPRKIEALESLGLHASQRTSHAAGATAATAVRQITTREDKQVFTYDFSLVSDLCEPGKRINTGFLLSLSRRQAKVFVDALIFFDGNKNKKSYVRRFHTSRLDHLRAFELAASIAGYAVNRPKACLSDISTKPWYCITISERNEIPVFRHGRPYHNLNRASNRRKHNGLKITRNTAGEVWCVTVPSGLIVVRRNGFSMVCGNCAEALALRKAFPQDLSGLYTADEFDKTLQDDANVIDGNFKSAASGNCGKGQAQLEAGRDKLPASTGGALKRAPRKQTQPNPEKSLAEAWGFSLEAPLDDWRKSVEERMTKEAALAIEVNTSKGMTRFDAMVIDDWKRMKMWLITRESEKGLTPDEVVAQIAVEKLLAE